VRHEGPTSTQITAPRPATSRLAENIAKDTDDSATDSDNRSVTPSGTGHHKRVKSRSKGSTRGRNRSDLPQQYNSSPETRFDERFLPEIQFLYGLEPDPWGHLSVALVQRARDKVFTEFQDTLSTKSAVFRNVRNVLSFPPPQLTKNFRRKNASPPGAALCSRKQTKWWRNILWTRTASQQHLTSHAKPSSSSEIGRSYLGYLRMAPTLRGLKTWYAHHHCAYPVANGHLSVINRLLSIIVHCRDPFRPL
jgi:hypothetical protein